MSILARLKAMRAELDAMIEELEGSSVAPTAQDRPNIFARAKPWKIQHTPDPAWRSPHGNGHLTEAGRAALWRCFDDRMGVSDAARYVGITVSAASTSRKAWRRNRETLNDGDNIL